VKKFVAFIEFRVECVITSFALGELYIPEWWDDRSETAYLGIPLQRLMSTMIPSYTRPSTGEHPLS
jgi:hypothetical protein